MKKSKNPEQTGSEDTKNRIFEHLSKVLPSTKATNSVTNTFVLLVVYRHFEIGNIGNFQIMKYFL